MRDAFVLSATFVVFGLAGQVAWTQEPLPAPGSKLPVPAVSKILTAAECNSAKLGAAIPVSAIGEPVAGVTLNPPVWVEAKGDLPASCSVGGSMAPIDKSPTAKAINFRVLLPASWNHRAGQIGGGGMNGTVPVLTGLSPTFGAGVISPLQRGFATYGSDSGHQSGPARGRVRVRQPAGAVPERSLGAGLSPRAPTIGR